MPKYTERRNFNFPSILVGDKNRLRRKDDIPLREKLLDTIMGISRDASYLMPVSEQQLEMELARGHIRAIFNRQTEITAHLRCLPVSYNTSMLMTLYGTTGRQALKVLENLAPNKTFTMETVNKHLRDLGITEADLLSVGFNRSSRTKLGPLYLAQTNFLYLRSDPIKYIHGFFQKETNLEEYLVFIRQGNQ